MTPLNRPSALVAAAALVVGGLAVSTGATSAAPNAPSRHTSVTQRPSTTVDRLAVKPQALSRPTQVRVVIELAGETVTEKSAAAAARGQKVTKATKATARAQVRASQDPTVEALRAAGARVDRRYTDTLTGVSATVSTSSIDTLAALPGVLSVQRVTTYKPNNGRSNNYTGASAAWQSLGATGAGVKVAILDTGVDYGHADFGGAGTVEVFDTNDTTVINEDPAHLFPTAKVVAGYDFVGDNYDASSTDPAHTTPVPDPDPLDCEGHGTHVAGTAAGLGVTAGGATYPGPYTQTDVNNANLAIAPGSAPEALLMAYRIFGCEGSVDDTVIIAAIDRAVADGAQVINMSLGSPYGRAAEASSKAIANAVKAGTTVVASAGNDGDSPYMVGGPSTSPAALSVAAADVIADFPGATLSHDTDSLQLQVSNGVSPLPATGTLLVLSDGSGGIGDGCLESDYAGAAGKIVVAKRGGDCARVDRAGFGQTAGAAGVILVNNTTGYPPYEGAIDDVTIPFFGALEVDGAALQSIDYFGITVDIASNTLPNPGYKSPASFTSSGPRSGDAGAKPDVIAPGVSLVSAASGTGFGSLTASGTSMSAPHTAGIVALVRGAHPGWTAQQAKDAVANTASIDPSLIVGDLRSIGNGMVQPLAAINAQILLQADKKGQTGLSFGVREGDSLNAKARIQVINTGIAPTIVDLAATAEAGVTLAVSPSSITARPGTTEVEVTIAMTKGAVSALPSAGDVAIPLLSGRVTATASGVSPVSMPVQVVQHGRSKVEASYQSSKNSSTITVRNRGTHTGTADTYEWLVSDGRDRKAAFDLRALGAQSFDAAGDSDVPNDRLVVMALNGYQQFWNASENEYDIYLDTTGDATPEVAIVATDYGLLTTGYPDGTLGVFVIDLNTEEISVFEGFAPVDGSTIELGMFASSLGLSAAQPIATILQVDTYSLTGHGVDESVGGLKATFNAFDPQRSSGDYVTLSPGDSAALPVTSRKKARGEQNSKGWMVVSVDNRAGEAQASLVSAGR